MVKYLSAMQEAWVRALGGDDSLEEGMATLSSILAEEFQGQGSLGATVHGVAESRTRLSYLVHTYTLFYRSVGSGKIGVQKLNQRAVFLVFRTENECYEYHFFYAKLWIQQNFVDYPRKLSQAEETLFAFQTEYS